MKKLKHGLTTADAFGWSGAVILVVMYLLNSFGAIGAQTLLYQLANLIGALLLLVFGVMVRAFPNVFVNAIWSIGAVVAIILIVF